MGTPHEAIASAYPPAWAPGKYHSKASFGEHPPGVTIPEAPVMANMDLTTVHAQWPVCVKNVSQTLSTAADELGIF